jgi:hypothetical protein
VVVQLTGEMRIHRRIIKGNTERGYKLCGVSESKQTGKASKMEANLRLYD